MSFQNNIGGLSALNPTEARHQIDQTIQTLVDKIRALKTQRNSLAPISRLPPEILARVFTLTISDPLAHDALGWVQVSYVSRHWRQVALDYPSLWGNLVLTQPKWCKEMLKRSKTASLTVKANLHNMTLKSAELFKFIMLQGPRIHELQLHCTTDRIMEGLLSIDPLLHLPKIHSLSLSINLYDDFNTSQSFNLPQSMLSSETPYLRQLDLRRCNVTWDIPLFNGLTSLSIHNHQWFTKPTIEQLINTLKRMPALDVLELRNVLPPSVPGSPALTTENSINLTELTDLIVTSTVLGYTSLIGLVKIPRTTRIYFDCTDSDFSGIVGIHASKNLDDSGRLMPKMVIRTLNIELYKPALANILSFNGWTAFDWPGLQPKPEVQLRFPLPPLLTTDIVPALITNVCNTIDLRHLRSLRVTLASQTITKNTWIKMFGNLLQLRSIHVETVSAYTLIAALHDAPPKHSTPTFPKRLVSTKGTLSAQKYRSSRKREQFQARSLYFPRLQYLTIRASGFESGIMPLRNCMKYRSRYEANLQELCLCECRYLSGEDVKLLKEVVKVRWDRIVQEYDNYEDNYDDNYDDSYGDDDDDDVGSEY